MPSSMARLLRLAALSWCCVATTACVQRGLTVTSEPSGAQVSVQGIPAGLTPVRIPFRHGGPRLVRVDASGFEPQELVVDSEERWLDTPGLDLIGDLKSDDQELELHVQLVPESGAERYERDPWAYRQGLKERAAELRARASRLSAGPPNE